MSDIITLTAGIDTSKNTLDMAIHGQPKLLHVPNTSAGWTQIAAVLAEAGVRRVGIEATGGYERGVSGFLRGRGCIVAVLQPKQVKAFAALHLRRAKTDRIDAVLIAACTHMLSERDRMAHDQRFEALGDRTALALVIRLPELGQVSREQAASLAGLAPFVHQSGKWQGQTHIGGGRGRLRRSLFAAAFAGAHHWNPALIALHARLKARGTSHTSAIVACARKLLVIVNAVVARGTPWEARTQA